MRYTLWGRVVFLALPLLAACQMSPLQSASPTLSLGPTSPLNQSLLDADAALASGLGGDPFVIAPGANTLTPAIAFNPRQQTYLVVWAAIGFRASDVYGQLIDRNGVPIGAPIPIVVESLRQGYPSVVYNRVANQFLVTWVSANEEDQRPVDVYARRVSASGQLLGDGFLIAKAGGSTLPAVDANLDRNEYMVVWTDYRGGTGNVFAQRVGAAGRLKGAAFAVSPGTGLQTAPSVAYDTNDGEYMVAWSDNRNGNSDLFARRLGDDGSLLGKEQPITTEPGDQQQISITYNLNDSRYLVAWNDGPVAQRTIYSQALRRGGTPIGAKATVGVTSYFDARPAIAFNPSDDQYLVAWTDGSDWPTPPRVFGRRFAGATAQPLADGFLISAFGSTVDGPVLAFNTPRDEYVAAWTQSATDARGIYGQRISGR